MNSILSILSVFVVFFADLENLRASEPPIELTQEGSWNVPLRYWAHTTPFHSAGSFCFLTEVISLEKDVPPQDKGPLRFRSGKLKVIESLNAKSIRSRELAKVKYLNVEGTESLKLKDKVIVFVCEEPYEGGYVVNYHEGSSLLGIRLPDPDDLNFGEKEQNLVISALRSGTLNLASMNEDQIKAWIIADPTGVAQTFSRELANGRLKWIR